MFLLFACLVLVGPVFLCLSLVSGPGSFVLFFYCMVLCVWFFVRFCFFDDLSAAPSVSHTLASA